MNTAGLQTPAKESHEAYLVRLGILLGPGDRKQYLPMMVIDWTRPWTDKARTRSCELCLVLAWQRNKSSDPDPVTTTQHFFVHVYPPPGSIWLAKSYVRVNHSATPNSSTVPISDSIKDVYCATIDTCTDFPIGRSDCDMTNDDEMPCIIVPAQTRLRNRVLMVTGLVYANLVSYEPHSLYSTRFRPLFHPCVRQS
jgi:hypothetical protein